MGGVRLVASKSNVFPPDCERLFEPKKLIASGGFGSIWLATQRNLERPVAIKLLHPAGLLDSVQVERFRNEARITATLTHPNIVILLDHGIEYQIPWIAYEYVPGRTLRSRLALGLFPWESAFEIGRQVASALEVAHEHGVLHRDIKPENILEISENNVKVADFGIALWNSRATRLTTDGAILGTPEYVSPGMVRGEEPGPEVDIYALGATLYELITGAPPFVASTPLDTLTLKLKSRPQSVRTKFPQLPVAANELLLRSLSPVSAENFATASQFHDALDAVLHEGSSGRTLWAKPVPGAPGSVPSGSVSITRVVVQPVPTGRVNTRPLTPTEIRRTVFRLLPFITGLSVIAILASLLLSLHLFQRPPLHQDPPPATPAAVRIVDSAGALTGGWKPFKKYLRALRTGGKTATDAVLQIHAGVGEKKPPVDFGNRAAFWRTWIELNEWLESPRDERPAFLHSMAPAGSSDDLFAFIFIERLKGLNPPLTASAVARTISFIADAPGQGRFWLLLGAALEMDGRPDAGLSAYRLGMELQGQQPIRGSSGLMWYGLARALSLISGRSVEKDWLTYVSPAIPRPHGEQDEILAALVTWASVTPGGYAIYARIANQLLHTPVWGAGVHRRLGVDYVNGVLGFIPENTIKIWTEGAAEFPNDREFGEQLLLLQLQLGDIEGAQNTATKIYVPERCRNLLTLLTSDRVPGGLMPNLSHMDADDWAGPNAYIFRLLEDGRLQEAQSAAQELQQARPEFEDMGWICRELAAAGVKSASVQNGTEVGLIGPFLSWGEWDRALGALTTPDGIPVMEKLLSVEYPKGPNPAENKIFRALWLSRRGKYEEALDIVYNYAKTTSAGGIVVDRVLEILMRPVWAYLLGSRAAAGAAQRALNCPVEFLQPFGKQYRSLMKQGKIEAAAEELTHLINARYHSSTFPLLAVWHAAYSKDPSRLQKCLDRARIMARMNRYGVWFIHELDRIAARTGREGL